MFTSIKTIGRFGALVLLGGALLTPPALADEQVNVTDVTVPSHNFQFALMTSYREMKGRWDPYGYYTAFPDGSSSWSLMNNLSVSYRLSSEFEAGLAFSFHDSHQSFASGSSSGTSFGNPVTDIRYHLPRNSFARFIAHVGLSLPFSVYSRDIQGDPGKDANTDNASEGGFSGLALRAGIGAMKRIEFLNLRLAYDAAVIYPFARDQDTQFEPVGATSTTIQNGIGYSMSQGISYPITRKWSANAGFRQMWEMDRKANGEDVPGSASRVFSTKAGASFNPTNDWRVNAEYDTPFPFYAYLVNQPYSPNVSVSAIYTGI